MKLAILLTLLTVLQASAFSYAQRVTMKANNIALNEAMETVQKQTGYLFFFRGKDIAYTRVSANIADADLTTAMNMLLEDLPLSWSLEEETIIIAHHAMKGFSKGPTLAGILSLQASINGRITDESGNPLPGATVTIKGTSTAATSNENGNYQITLPGQGGTLVFTMLGFDVLEQPVSGSSVINVTMTASMSDLEEVVVVGYGTQKKVNLTGAVSAIDGEALAMRPSGQTSAALQGLAPGVTVTQRSGKPGSDGAGIRIRGIGTMGSSADPMVLIDGIEGSMNNIDPNLIESVSVLKDAASASIYGSRAANGVILITTKRGAGDRISLSYNNYVGWQSPTNMPDMVDALDHLLLTNEAYVNTGRSPLYPDALIEEYRAQNGVSSDAYPNTDWQKETLTGSGLQHSHFLTVNGGTNKVKMLASFGYFDQQGLIESTSFKRYTIRNNMDITFSDKLSARVDLQYVNPITKAPAVSVNDIFQWMNGIPANEIGINANGTWGVGWNGNNPISAAVDRGFSLNKGPFGSINAFLNYKPFEWLSAEINYAPKYATTVSKTFHKTVQSYLPDGTPSFAVPQRTSLTQGNSQQLYNNMRATLTASKLFGDHDFRWLVGASREDFTNEFINGFRDIYVLPDYPVLDAGSAENQRATGSGEDWALQSFFSRINYNYQEKYLLELNARYDGSSRFAKGNQYGFFPSMSAGWRFSEEGFMAGTKGILSEGKVRASWGRLGNQLIGTYPFVVALDMGSTALGGQIVNTAALNNMANRDISWESTEERNIGVDLIFFNRLSLTADLYHRRTSDILLELDIPLIIGLNRPRQNAGAVENKGWEIALGYNSSPNREFRYNLIFNLSDVHNKITDMRGINQTSITADREGHPIASLFGYQTAGYFQTAEEVSEHATQFGSVAPGDLKYVDQNGDGFINESDKVIIGSTIPRLTYSLIGGFRYKGFDFNAMFQGVGKADGYLWGAGIMPFSVTGAIGGTIREDNKDRWTPDNPNAKYPRLAFGQSNNEQASDFWLRDASYLRLKNLQLGYSFPQHWLSAGKLQQFRIFANGTNLFSIDNFWDGYDVEAPVGNGNFYPQVKVYTFGLEVTF
ncbi:SusC/RagA family TonB-linked outer membrane protein [Parapedobacter sp. DT-150]|uniref:SusC/RagA family TonB-linked outer membrane protein n=1 Tax=Parapedobacter sp. DT-150 TaxID=3396162 RepID=UPI003F1BB981